MNRAIVLRRRPREWPSEDDFELVERALPALAEGELRVRNHWLSLDPYMRGRMNEAKSYAPSVDLGAVMVGGTVGVVEESRHPVYAVGDAVTGSLGWQTHSTSDGRGLRKVRSPRSIYVGVVGMPGVTAWIGLFDIGQPKAGETVVVSAASGAVGSVVGQLAKEHGCRVVGIAGGAKKCAHVVDELGFDACVDYKEGALRADLAAATPNGIDVYFENVGGEVLDAVSRRLNPFARIPLCGLIADYNTTAPRGMPNLGALLFNRVKLQGFIVSDHLERWPAALAALEARVEDGRLKYAETIVEGIASAPRAFLGLLRGENHGKMIVKLVH